MNKQKCIHGKTQDEYCAHCREDENADILLMSEENLDCGLKNDELIWVLNLVLRELNFAGRLKVLRAAKKWQKFFHENKTDAHFAGVRACNELNAYLVKFTSYYPAVKLGRLTCGFQKDMGSVVHAVTEFGSLCGAKPGGRRSVGWSDPIHDTGNYTTVTCDKCLVNIQKLQQVING